MQILPKKEMCCGCEVCISICNKDAICMEYDNEGFRYPQIDIEKCVDCKLCVRHCPILHHEEMTKTPTFVYAAYNLDEKIRLNSSSGGIFTALAMQIIREGGVVFGAAFSNDCKHVYMCVAENEDELGRFQGSKYTQCEMNGIYLDVETYLRQNRKVLFSGTPCHIGALKAFLGEKYNNLYTVDFICHGVPAPYVWEQYVLYHEKIVDASVRKVSFRHKNTGWKTFSVLFRFTNSIEYCKYHTDDMFFSGFNQNLFLRPSCYECVFKGNMHMSDITLGDFWGIEKIFPDFDDDKGTSVVICNTNLGYDLWARIDSVMKRETELSVIKKYNRSYYQSAERNFDRERFLKKVNSDNIEKLLHKYCDYTIFNRIKNKIRRSRWRLNEKSNDCIRNETGSY